VDYIASKNNEYPLIEFNSLTVMRGTRVVIDNLSLKIKVGEHVAILGPNGSGKSTLIKTITREQYPVAGDHNRSFKIMGKEVWNVFDLRGVLGIVHDDTVNSRAYAMSGREMVLSGFFGSVGLFTNHEVTAAMQRKANEVLEFLEIRFLADKYITEMSSGEYKRLVIARALVHQPRALLLDEPTNSLDIHAFFIFHQMLRKIAQSGTSIILVTHNLQDIIPEIERVIMIKEGKIFKDGPKKAVLTTAHISSLYNMSLEVSQSRDCYTIHR
jgi:iron complex transport system ATP-binding protein